MILPMNGHSVAAVYGHNQLHLANILSVVPVTSPISHNSKEIEQKYLFSKNRADCQKIYQAREFQAAGVVGRKDGRPFHGVDYYFTAITKDRQYFAFRYRTGLTGVKSRVGLKVKNLRKRSIVRDEFEFDLKPGVDERRVCDFLRIVASTINGGIRETPIRVEGQIRYAPLALGGDQKIEVVVFTGTNLVTDKMVCVGEIEAHGFLNETAAKLAISQYEDKLQWRQFRTNKSMSQLLESR